MYNDRMFVLIIICLFGILISLFAYTIKNHNKCHALGGAYINGQCIDIKVIKL